MKVRISVVGLLFAGLLVVSAAFAPAAFAGLPPRPTVIPTQTETALSGGLIMLHLKSSQTNLWTVVQWQDALGGWHDVRGWQGTPDEDGLQVWWVAPADLNKGPFRWAIFRKGGGGLLALSQPFYLPGASSLVMVEVDVKP